MPRKISLAAALGMAAAAVYFIGPQNQVQAAGRTTQGSLVIFNRDGQPQGECPLKHTSVSAEISGFLARVRVVQDFENSASDKVEAVYTFPLPQNAAVDDMTMHVGERTIRGLIKKREEARAIYDRARQQGRVASLLDQERPNIFTQHVANIAPGAKVRIEISYVETLKYEEGIYEFVFPMVVGPRYIPAGRVPDAARITPPVTPPGTRAGHDISLAVKLDAGVPVEKLECGSHPVLVDRPGTHQAVVKLKDQAVLPNKDFVLKYAVAGRKIQDAVLTHHAARGGFFTLILQPPERVTTEDVTPKELVFVLDTSGSMSGFPVEKAKETMRLALEGLYPRDTFNLITFSGDTHILFPQPVAATRENLRIAQEFLAARRGGGGTEMMKAIRAALDQSDSQGHVRIVCFMTDGYVGNDAEIIAEVKKHQNARVFAFGIGSSVNRYLLDNVAREGRGEVEYVALSDDGSAAARRFHERVRNPLLTDVTLDFGGLPVADVLPKRIPDLFSAKPVVVTGRYTTAARGFVRLHGRMSGRAVSREIVVDLPGSQPEHDVLATLWARNRIAGLSSENAPGMQAEVTQLGLEYRLMTQYTSFIAVEESTVIEGGQPRRVEVPVEMPEGVSYEGVFGVSQERAADASMRFRGSAAVNAPGGGVVGGIVGGVFGGAKSQAMERRELPAAAPSTLHPTIEQLKNGTLDEAVKAKFVRNGKATVEVWLDAAPTPEILAALKKLGFEAQPGSQVAKVVIGSIAVDKLEALGQLAGVRMVAPHSAF